MDTTATYYFYEFTLPDLTGIGSARYCIRHTSRQMVFQFKDFTLTSNVELAGMTSKLDRLWSGLSFPNYDWFDPYYHKSDSLPDNYFINAGKLEVSVFKKLLCFVEKPDVDFPWKVVGKFNIAEVFSIQLYRQIACHNFFGAVPPVLKHACWVAFTPIVNF